jgi:hypothetical protein
MILTGSRDYLFFLSLHLTYTIESGIILEIRF